MIRTESRNCDQKIAPLLFATIVLAWLAIFPTHAAEEPAFASFDAKGVQLRYLEKGAGEPVVLIHGLSSSVMANWKRPGIVDLLAKKYRVIALDLPGHGGSDKPDKPETYGVQMVEDVILLLDHLKIKQAHIVGYSLGGMITLKLLTLHPDRVLSGTLGGMGWMQEGSPFQAMWDKLPALKGVRAPTACVNSMGKLAITESALKTIRTPVTVLIGDQDPIKILFVGPLQTVRKDWPVVEIEAAGHLTCIVQKKFADEMVKWLEQNPAKNP